MGKQRAKIGDFWIDLNEPLDLSIPLSEEGPRAWYAPRFQSTAVRDENFLGSVAEGGNVNFRNVQFNPHGNGTHTESVGHIDQQLWPINQQLRNFFHRACLISIEPARISVPRQYVGLGQYTDLLIKQEQIELAIQKQVDSVKADFWNGDIDLSKALIIRTLPNPESKKQKDWSGSHPPYLSPEAASWMRKQGIKHLLLDLPSLDREADHGKLLAHRAFWNYPDNPDKEATITEMIYAGDSIADGFYILNLMIAPFELDASPSKPILYRLASAD